MDPRTVTLEAGFDTSVMTDIVPPVVLAIAEASALTAPPTSMECDAVKRMTPPILLTPVASITPVLPTTPL